jgi:hypothetical protein
VSEWSRVLWTGVQGPKAVFSKARLTWITDDTCTERWIAASCGSYSVLWNFRKIKSQQPTILSQGAYTICDHYMLQPRNGPIVEHAFLHDKFAVAPQAKKSLVAATAHSLLIDIPCTDEEAP